MSPFCGSDVAHTVWGTLCDSVQQANAIKRITSIQLRIAISFAHTLFKSNLNYYTASSSCIFVGIFPRRPNIEHKLYTSKKRQNAIRRNSTEIRDAPANGQKRTKTYGINSLSVTPPNNSRQRQTADTSSASIPWYSRIHMALA